MNDEGIPLIWVPRGNIVGALMSASGTAKRHAILIGARDDVVADCLAVLAEVTALELVPLAGLAADSGRALRDGHCAASQALSANVFDTWLRDVVSRGKLFKPPGDREPFYEAIKRQIIGVSDNTSLGAQGGRFAVSGADGASEFQAGRTSSCPVEPACDGACGRP